MSPKSCLVLYLGHLEGMVHVGDQYLARILLVDGKKTMTKNWLKSDTPSYKQWMSMIDDILVMEHLTYEIFSHIANERCLCFC